MRCDGFSATSPIAFRLLGSSISDWLRALSGVRQGNVLGPLLFAIYINDLPAALSFARVMIYADDTQVHFHLFSVNIHQAIARTCIDAQAVADWARENGLLLNPLETKVMILGHELYTTRLDLHPPKSHDLWLCASARFWGTYPRRYNHANPRLEITRGWNHSYGLQHPFYSAFSSPLTLKIVEENSRGEPVPTLRLYVYSLPPPQRYTHKKNRDHTKGLCTFCSRSPPVLSTCDSTPARIALAFGNQTPWIPYMHHSLLRGCEWYPCLSYRAFLPTTSVDFRTALVAHRGPQTLLYPGSHIPLKLNQHHKLLTTSPMLLQEVSFWHFLRKGHGWLGATCARWAAFAQPASHSAFGFRVIRPP